MSATSPLFMTGQLLQTHGARDKLVADDVQSAIRRHFTGDWGEVNDHDRRANDGAVLDLGRVFSVYLDRKGQKFYVITEADRSATTVMLPEEY